MELLVIENIDKASFSLHYACFYSCPALRNDVQLQLEWVARRDNVGMVQCVFIKVMSGPCDCMFCPDKGHNILHGKTIGCQCSHHSTEMVPKVNHSGQHFK